MTGPKQDSAMARSTALLRLSAVLLVVAAIVRPGEGLRCYQCTSDSDPKCESQPQQIANCEDLPDLGQITGGLLEVKPACLKAIVKNNEGQKIMMRNCVMDTSVMKPCDIAGKINLPKNAEITYCGTCQSDLCNSSNRLVISVLPLLFPCIITLILTNIY